MNRKTISGYHSGVSYFVHIDDHRGKIKVSSVILFQTHNHEIDWNKQGEIDILKPWEKCKGNHFFYSDPSKNIVDATTGFIDAVLDPSNKQTEKLINEAELMRKMKPETNPTPEEIKTMREGVEKLIQYFSVVGLSHLTGNSSQTINGWKSRGRVSASAAHEMCQLEEIKSLGFTRETLRPDVKYWYIDGQSQ